MKNISPVLVVVVVIASCGGAGEPDAGPGDEWVSFGGTVVDGHVRTWSRDDGDGWLEDSPEGGSTEVNAVVHPGGLLSVPA